MFIRNKTRSHTISKSQFKGISIKKGWGIKIDNLVSLTDKALFLKGKGRFIGLG